MRSEERKREKDKEGKQATTARHDSQCDPFTESETKSEGERHQICAHTRDNDFIH